MTTVSKPKRNPASAEVSDQKKMRLFISGELQTASLFRQGITLLPPVANAAVHGNHVGVAHLLQIICGQRRAESAAAIENYFRTQIGHTCLDIALDDAFAQVNCPGKMVLGKFAFFP